MNLNVAAAPWPTFHQNNRHTGLSPFIGPSEPSLKWRFLTGAGILSSPAVAFGTIYVGSDDGSLYAIDREGELEWKFTTGGPIETSPAIGPRGVIYVGSSDGYLYAVNRDGSLRWRWPPGNNNFDILHSSPTVGSDGTIYIAIDVNDYAKLWAIRPDGTVKWSLTTGALVYDAPAIAPDGTIYIGIDDPGPTAQCGKCLQAVNPDGTAKWGSDTGQVESSSPTVGRDGTVYIGTVSNVFSAVSVTGTKEWNITGSLDETFGSTAAVGPRGTVYVTSTSTSCLPLPIGCSQTESSTSLYAVRPDGIVTWRFSTPSSVSGSPGCCNFFTVSSPVVDSKGVVYVGSADGNLYAIRADGSQSWRISLGGAIASTPAIDLGGTIYVGSMNGNLYAMGDADQ
jgi:outer membrane protein assembly factor BamB